MFENLGAWRIAFCAVAAYLCVCGVAMHIVAAEALRRIRRHKQDNEAALVRFRFHPERGVDRYSLHMMRDEDLWINASKDELEQRRLLLTIHEIDPNFTEWCRTGDPAWRDKSAEMLTDEQKKIILETLEKIECLHT